MSQIISVYNGSSETIMELQCPKCNSVVDVNLPKFVMAINKQESFWCAHCWSKFVFKVELLDRVAEQRNEAVTSIRGTNDLQPMYECGNCGVPRFVHGVILESCPNCGDDETDLSLIDDVP